MNSTLNGVDIMLQHSKHQDENVKKNKRKTRISVAGLYDPETRIIFFWVSAMCSKQDNFVKSRKRTGSWQIRSFRKKSYNDYQC